MKISYNWLKEFVDINVTPSKLGEDLSLFGHEVEKIEKKVYPEQKRRDYILDFEITPNRGDLLSILGMAREVVALYNSNYELRIMNYEFKEKRLDKRIKIKIQNQKICPRFTARIIDNIKIGESPRWIQERLKSYGFRPINNIVDITNYVMIETGQPLHAFDYDKISNGIMNIKLAKKNRSVVTLDGKDRALDENSIIIKDNQKIYDLAGIMGGFNSEVDKNTKTIVLQGAIFDPILIRRTSKRLNLMTDASYRYERGVDISGTIQGVNRAATIIKEICKSCKIGKIYDYQNKINEVKINFDYKKINNLIGTNLNKKQIDKYLKALNFIVEKNNVKVPIYRQYDVKIWQDIAEEVARKYGYYNIKKSYFEKEKTQQSIDFAKKENLKDKLVDNGFTEIYSYSFSDEKLIKLLEFNINNCRFVINSVTEENKYLRPDLSVSILQAITKNPWAPDINIFEIGKVFDKNEEKWQLAIACDKKNINDLKKILAQLKINEEIKTLDQKVSNYLKIRKQIKYTIIDLQKINNTDIYYKNTFEDKKYREISEFSPTIRDLAFIVENNINALEIAQTIKNISSEILIVELFDEFQSDKFGLNKKNVAYHIWLQDIKKPMKQNKVDNICKKIIKIIETKYIARLR